MIYIDIPMPSSCRECPFRERDMGYCILFSYGVPNRYQIDKFTERPSWCELKGEEKMPRLIDAKKLAEYKASGVSKLTDWQRGWSDAIDTIMGEAPTVDAIPIEWIKEWVNNYCDWNQEQLIGCLLRTWNKNKRGEKGCQD